MKDFATNFNTNEKQPKKGWLSNEPTTGGGYSVNYYECHIEDYNEDGAIEMIGFRKYNPSNAQEFKDVYYPFENKKATSKY